MDLTVFWFLVVLLFAAQLILCLTAKQLKIKLIPVYVLGAWGVYVLLCWIGVVGGENHLFATVLQGLLLSFFAVVDVLAWLIYRFIKSIQNRRK